MPIERAQTQVIPKPWGRTDLRPWHVGAADGPAVGEIAFTRNGLAEPHLLLKLLFTSAPLSIQVHPDDAFAHLKGEPNGKTEAWYILAAAPDAAVALGLRTTLSTPQLRAAIADGSVADLVRWQPVVAGDAILVPAGTIHALGAGLVVAEIQQRSDTTYRLFDFGRGRTLHLEEALAVAHACPAGPRPAPWPLTEARTLLAASPYFVLERLVLGAGSRWALNATPETWLLVIEGEAQCGTAAVTVGEAMVSERDHTPLTAGPVGATALLAYAAARPLAGLLDSLDAPAVGRSTAPVLPPEALSDTVWAPVAPELRP